MTGPVGRAEDDDDRGRQRAVERSVEIALDDGPEIVRRGSPEHARRHDGRPSRVPLAMHDRGIARADQLVADGQHGHAGAAMADGVDAALRREQADQRQAEPCAGRRQQGARPGAARRAG